MKELDQLKEFIEGFFITLKLSETDRKFKIKNNYIVIETKSKYHITQHSLFCELYEQLDHRIVIGFTHIDKELESNIYLYGHNKRLIIHEPYKNQLEVKFKDVEDVKEFFIEVIGGYFE